MDQETGKPETPEGGPPGWQLRAAGSILLACGFLSGFALWSVRLHGAGALLLLVTPVLLVLGGAMIYRGKQHEARARSLALAPTAGVPPVALIPFDPRPPVVYLRRFADDESGVATVLSTLYKPQGYLGVSNDEEQLAEAVAPIGPMVTIGQPGEVLPRPGAARVYAGDDEWREVVDGWLSRSRLVIIRPGLSEGVFWEIEHAFERVERERLLLLLWKTSHEEYTAFAAAVHARGIELPRLQPDGLPGIIEFTSNGEARHLPLTSPFWRTTITNRFRQKLHYALRPVFERLGVTWSPQPVLKSRIALAAGLGLIGLLISYVAVMPPPGPPDEVIAVRGDHLAVPLYQQQVAGLRLLTPSQFTRTTPAAAAWPYGVDSLESFANGDGRMTIGVQAIWYSPSIVVSSEASMTSSLEALAGLEGAEGFRSERSRAEVSGLPAVRSTARVNLGGQPMTMRTLYFSSGQRLWMVTVGTADSTGMDETAEQIIGSVRRMPEP